MARARNPERTLEDYQRLALSIAWRRFPAWAESERDDVAQECALVAWEAVSRGRIQCGHGAKRIVFGMGSRPGAMGIRPYLRAVYRRLYAAAKNAGYTKNRGQEYGVPSEREKLIMHDTDDSRS